MTMTSVSSFAMRAKSAAGMVSKPKSGCNPAIER